MKILEFRIQSAEAIALNATFQEPSCFGYQDGSVSLSASGGYGEFQYLWGDGITGAVRNEMGAGEYEVTVTDRLGCEGFFELVLTQPEKVHLDLGGKATICGGMNYVLEQPGFETYLWRMKDSILGRQSNIILDSAGTYTLKVTTEKGCIARDTFYLKVDNELLDANFLMPTTASVNDTIAAIDISYPEPDSIAWSFEGSPRIFDWEPSESNPYTRFIQYTEKGTYAVMLFSVKAECRDSLVKNIQITESTRDTSEKKHLGADAFIRSFKLYPNPSAGTFKAEVKLKKRVPIMLEVRDLKYQKVIDQQMKTGSREYTVYYQFRNLSPGIYLVILKVENEQKTIRIIIT
jgi:hypothetical protein